MSPAPLPVNENGNLSYDAVQALHERRVDEPATVEHFAGTEGAKQWALLDGFAPDKHTGSTKAICEIEILRVLPNEIEIVVVDGDELDDPVRRCTPAELVELIEAT